MLYEEFIGVISEIITRAGYRFEYAEGRVSDMKNVRHMLDYTEAKEKIMETLGITTEEDFETFSMEIDHLMMTTFTHIHNDELNGQEAVEQLLKDIINNE